MDLFPSMYLAPGLVKKTRRRGRPRQAQGTGLGTGRHGNSREEEAHTFKWN